MTPLQIITIVLLAVTVDLIFIERWKARECKLRDKDDAWVEKKKVASEPILGTMLTPEEVRKLHPDRAVRDMWLKAGQYRARWNLSLYGEKKARVLIYRVVARLYRKLVREIHLTGKLTAVKRDEYVCYAITCTRPQPREYVAPFFIPAFFFEPVTLIAVIGICCVADYFLIRRLLVYREVERWQKRRAAELDFHWLEIRKPIVEAHAAEDCLDKLMGIMPGLKVFEGLERKRRKYEWKLIGREKIPQNSELFRQKMREWEREQYTKKKVWLNYVADHLTHWEGTRGSRAFAAASLRSKRDPLELFKDAFGKPPHFPSKRKGRE